MAHRCALGTPFSLIYLLHFTSINSNGRLSAALAAALARWGRMRRGRADAADVGVTVLACRAKTGVVEADLALYFRHASPWCLPVSLERRGAAFPPRLDDTGVGDAESAAAGRACGG